VEPFSALDGVYASFKQYLEARQPMAVVSVLDGPPDRLNRKLIVLPDGRTEGDLDVPGQAEKIVAAALDFLEREKGGTLELEGDTSLFVEVYPPVPRLIVVGATHIADALVSMGNVAGFDTVVVDPRAAFATEERFPHATELIREWPQQVLPEMGLDRSAYVVLLTHDPKFDDPTLQVALRSGARYVGALGSRRTNEKRLERLRKNGLTEEELAHLHAPIGVPLGGRSPAEIAVSIMAEIVQVRNGVSTRQPALE
jgi:xanthine dehydrogenase accessory factor